MWYMLYSNTSKIGARIQPNPAKSARVDDYRRRGASAIRPFHDECMGEVYVTRLDHEAIVDLNGWVSIHNTCDIV